MPEARTLLTAGALGIAAVATAGYLVTQGSELPGAATVSAAPAVSGTPTTPMISPPPADPEDVATDTAVPTVAALQITYAGADEAAGGVAVGAYVAGLIEESGSCALTLSQGARSAVAESQGVADASTTSCGQLVVPFSELGSGTWDAEVTYASPGGHPVAAGRTTVELP